ncbi:stage 0 sporulation family protein [Christensenellaceae bacterium OttesenSCG-928-M15]|nr:stage 0 sporulation family protein [Christensenellaceae bacterium OttesenSCG-928-M15]
MDKRVVGVRFRKAGRMYYFDPKDLEINGNDGVLVETAHGIEYGEVILTPREVPEEQIVAPLKEVLRIATDDDNATHARNMELEQEAFTICQEKIAQHELDMKLVDVEYSFNGSKITFFFTAEGRVDFRDLVKDLAFVFKTRIELRQIGVRDEAKMLGGLGSCGRPVCCKTFLTDFQPVSIKMAKEQKLSLSPTKISGLCGRLMCCLKYEQDAYEAMRKVMPKVSKEVITPDGKGMVLDNNAITEKTKVRLTLADGTVDVREYHFSEVRKPGTPEEEDAMRKELEVLVRERERRERSEEEEFRFVTGALREEKAPGEQPEEGQPEKRERDRQSNNNRRRPRRRPQQAGEGDGAEKSAAPVKQADRNNKKGQQRQRPQQPPPQKNVQKEAKAGDDKEKTEQRNRRQRRGGRNKPLNKSPQIQKPE